MVSKLQIMKNYKGKLNNLSEDEVKVYIDNLTKQYVLILYSKDLQKLKYVLYSLNEIRFIYKENVPEIESFINYCMTKNLRFVLGNDSLAYVPEAIESGTFISEVEKEEEGLRRLKEAFSDERTLRLEQENKELKLKNKDLEHDIKQLKLMLNGIDK